MELEGKGKVPKYGHVMGSMCRGSAAYLTSWIRRGACSHIQFYE